MFKELTYGMVGGDLKALIGECHRKALGLDPRAKLVCGCFSAIDELNDECAEAYHVDKSRVYYDAEKMAEAEAGKIDFVSICTPNFVHYSAAKTFLEHGINVVCEKPMTLTVEEAEDLARIESGLCSGLLLLRLCNVQGNEADDCPRRYWQDHCSQLQLHREQLPRPACREGTGQRPHLAH